MYLLTVCNLGAHLVLGNHQVIGDGLLLRLIISRHVGSVSANSRVTFPPAGLSQAQDGPRCSAHRPARLRPTAHDQQIPPAAKDTLCSQDSSLPDRCIGRWLAVLPNLLACSLALRLTFLGVFLFIFYSFFLNIIFVHFYFTAP